MTLGNILWLKMDTLLVEHFQLAHVKLKWLIVIAMTQYHVIGAAEESESPRGF
jgi:hypothetical protein